MGEKIVDARDISHAYVRGRTTLRDVSLGISRGELVAIVGENGSGKTTLARHLNALIPLQEGELRVAGIDAADAIVDHVVSEVRGRGPAGSSTTAGTWLRTRSSPRGWPDTGATSGWTSGPSRRTTCLR